MDYSGVYVEGMEHITKIRGESQPFYKEIHLTKSLAGYMVTWIYRNGDTSASEHRTDKTVERILKGGAWVLNYPQTIKYPEGI